MTLPKINPFQRLILVALNRLDKHIYAGVESPQARAARRRSDRLTAAMAIPGESRKARRAVTYATKNIERAARRAALREANA